MLSLGRLRFRQRGAALLLMLLALIIFAGTFIVYSSEDGEEIRISERERTARALAAAKEALVAHAAIDWLDLGPPPPATPRPGELPCPDTDNDGDSEGAACQNIGWLPWKTLELEDLRDTSGHRLWYAVSEDFQDDGNAEPFINPSFTGQFRILDNLGVETGRAVAVIIAPGPVLGGQNRSSDDIDTNVAVIQNYLEGENAESGAAFDNFFTDGLIAGAMNDQLMVITVEDIMDRVANIAMGEITRAMRLFYNDAANGFYPYSELDAGATCDNGTPVSRRNIGFPVINTVALPGECPYANSLINYGLPNWVTAFDWHRHMFSVVAEACIWGTVNCGGPGGFLSLDGIGGIRAMVVYTGRALNNITCFGNANYNQIRPPTAGWDNLCNFLETVENTNGDDDLVYVRPGLAVNSNDKFMIVAP